MTTVNPFPVVDKYNTAIAFWIYRLDVSDSCAATLAR
jgi:hypothetical protein